MRDADRASRRRNATRDRIATAASALFERHGYPAVTMEQIAAHADVARGTLYNHFPVKEAVLAHWMHAQLASDLTPLMQRILSQSSFATRMATLLEASAHWWEGHRQYAVPYIRYRFQQTGQQVGERPSSDMIGVHAQLIAHAQSARELRSDVPAARLAHYLHYLYLCALMSWLEEEESALSEGFGQMLDFFLQGARPLSRDGAR